MKPFIVIKRLIHSAENYYKMNFLKINKIDSILIDLSGTMHVDDQPTRNAVNALEKLKSLDIPYKFVTNTTKESSETLMERLAKIGFKVESDQIHSSLKAAANYIAEHNLNPFYLLSDDARKDFPAECNDNYDSVVVGLAPDKFYYDNINKAFKILLNEHRKLIAIHEGRYYKTKDEMAVGPGCFVKGLEYSCGVKSTVIGKPNEYFFKSSLPDGADPQNCIMIGDDVNDDIKGAQQIGIKGILVRSGKVFDETAPDFPNCDVLNDFSEAIDLIAEKFGKQK